MEDRFVIHNAFHNITFHALVTQGKITRPVQYKQENTGVEGFHETVDFFNARGGLPENVSFWSSPLFFGSVSDASRLKKEDGSYQPAFSVQIYKIVPSDDVARNPLGHYLREVWDASEKAKVLLEIQKSSSDYGEGYGSRVPVGYWINGDKYGGVPRGQFPRELAEIVFPIWDKTLGKSR